MFFSLRKCKRLTQRSITNVITVNNVIFCFKCSFHAIPIKSPNSTLLLRLLVIYAKLGKLPKFQEIPTLLNERGVSFARSAENKCIWSSRQTQRKTNMRLDYRAKRRGKMYVALARSAETKWGFTTHNRNIHPSSRGKLLRKIMMDWSTEVS